MIADILPDTPPSEDRILSYFKPEVLAKLHIRRLGSAVGVGTAALHTGLVELPCDPGREADWNEPAPNGVHHVQV